MKNPGPHLESLIDRLISIPEIFLEKTSADQNNAKKISVPAIFNDLMLDTGGVPLSDEEAAEYFSGKSPYDKDAKTGKKAGKKNNYPGLAGILCYIYEDDFFTEEKKSGELIKIFLLSEGLRELSAAVESADDFINDPDRREEICRRALDAVNYFPLGENEKNARDRLLTLDSVERKKILIKTSQAQLRAKEIRDAMLRQEAEEAASKMSRE